jgi:DDE superfamily endonuclease
LAFALSGLHNKLEGNNPHNENLPFLKPGLALYGDNAYINTLYMVTPFKAVSKGAKDAFNFYHSQVRINIECAFGMLVHRWGILRKAMPMNITLTKTSALVIALCKLHNFCIDENDERNCMAKPTAKDKVDIALHGGLDLSAFRTPTLEEEDGMIYQNEDHRLNELLDGGEHMDDVPRNMVRRVKARGKEQVVYPYEVMLQYVEEQGFQRPFGGRRVR